MNHLNYKGKALCLNRKVKNMTDELFEVDCPKCKTNGVFIIKLTKKCSHIGRLTAYDKCLEKGHKTVQAQMDYNPHANAYIRGMLRILDDISDLIKEEIKKNERNKNEI